MLSESDVRRVLETWRFRLGLCAWQLEFDPAPMRQKRATDAWVSWDSDYDRATLYLRDGWREWDEGRLGYTVAHELVHLVLRDVSHFVTEVLRPGSPELVRVWEHVLEGAVDRLAFQFTRLAPEPRS